MELSVLVYRHETFYFAHMHGWQAGLVAPMTKKYWRGYGEEPNLEFESDELLHDFWQTLDANRFGERYEVAVDKDLEPGKLIETAMQRAQESSASSHANESLYGLFHLESGTRIDADRPLTEYEIEDGDHLGLIIEHPPHAFYSLIPLPNSEAVFAAIRSADESPPDGSENTLRGALLYTDEDTEIATYVRRHFASLSEASGDNLHLYVIEQPESDWREASRYWEGVLDEQLQREWVTLGWLRTKPYKPEEAYRVARRLGVYPDELPCLVLYEDLADQEKLVFPLLDGSAKFFRGLFGRLQRLIVPGQTKEISFKGIRRSFDEIVTTLRDEAAEVKEDHRAVYNFDGQTVFINQPGGPVELSDFQKNTGKDER